MMDKRRPFGGTRKSEVCSTTALSGWLFTYKSSQDAVNGALIWSGGLDSGDTEICMGLDSGNNCTRSFGPLRPSSAAAKQSLPLPADAAPCRSPCGNKAASTAHKRCWPAAVQFLRHTCMVGVETSIKREITSHILGQSSLARGNDWPKSRKGR